MTFQLAERKIGTGSIPPIGFGALNLSGIPYGPVESDEERFKVCQSLVRVSVILMSIISYYYLPASRCSLRRRL